MLLLQDLQVLGHTEGSCPVTIMHPYVLGITFFSDKAQSKLSLLLLPALKHAVSTP